MTYEQYEEIEIEVKANMYKDVFRKVQSGDWTEEMFVEYMNLFAKDCAEQDRYGGC